uniref:Uncharacterized protein n=1 Tax=viral metagenome TaxID=1070528 RepID=A0A6C0EWV7_9ZZZZ
MSNSASISAAKKRRGGMPPPMAGGPGQPGQQMSLPPGLPPNFRQLPPQIQQQLFQQLQQRAAAATASSQPKPATAPQQSSMPPAPLQTRNPSSGMNNGNVNGATINVPGPYTVNPVIHNRAMAEVNGIHIRDLPISAAGLPCLPSGAALPPNVLFKLHHDELLNMDAILNEHSNKIQMLSNRVDKADKAERMQGGSGSKSEQVNNNIQVEQRGGSYDDIINNTDFIAKLLDNILTNTNLSDIINQIEPLQKENESLRSLLNSQQTTLNELSGLVMKLISNGLPSYTTGSDNCESGGDGDGDGDGDGGGGDLEHAYEIVQADITSSVYNPYITNDDNNTGNNISNDIVGNDGGNYNEMNYGMSEGGGGVFSVSLDNLEEVHD